MLANRNLLFHYIYIFKKSIHEFGVLLTVAVIKDLIYGLGPAKSMRFYDKE